MESEATETVRKVFGEVLRKKRKEQGWSQEELAHQAGIAMRYVSLLECNKRQPTISTIYALSKALGLSMSALMAEVEAAIPE